MMRVVLDSNVLVSAFATPDGATRHVFFAVQDNRFTLIISDYIIAEVAKTLVYKIKDPQDFVDARINALYAIAEVVDPMRVAHLGVDEQDLPILGTAVAGRADAIVTGDKKLLHLERFEGIAVITPRQFLESLASY